MKIYYIISIVAAVAITSCSTAYKSGQTPDDVYFSPVTYQDKTEDREEERYESTPERRQITMSVYDRRWRNLDYDYDYDYRYNPYKYGYGYGYYYNPYYYPYPVYYPGVTFSNPKNISARTLPLGGYTTPVVVTNPKTGSETIRRTRAYNTTNRNSTIVRDVLTPQRSTPRETNRDRTYTPSNNSNNNRVSTPAPRGSSVPRPSRGN